jgi:hypothetical protein
MPITVKHSKTSAIPDAGDSTLVQPSDWNADHTLTGLGTMAEQNANAVAITGGTISGVTIPASNVTGTLQVNQGGTGATTLTGYVKGAGTTALTASSTIPNTDITGLGTASTRDAGVANGVATLDAGGKVPVSELPAAVLGALSYQGTWDASTNTPTLTSSVGNKGYYYVVSVAGNTNLNGITDWLVGDWAVYNGTVWQKVDNTETVTSVNGQTGAVTLTTTNIAEGTNEYFTTARARTSISAGTGISYDNTTGVITNSSPSLGGDVVGPASATDNAITRFDLTTGKLIQNSIVTIDDNGNIANTNSINFDITPSTVPTTESSMYWDADKGAIAYVMQGGDVIQEIGESQYMYIQASASITKGQVVMFTGAIGGSGTPTGAPATGITDGTYIIGIAAEDITVSTSGFVQTFGILKPINTTGIATGEILWYNPAVTGGFTATKPTAPNVVVQVAAVTAGNSAGGALFIRITAGSKLGETDSNVLFSSLTGGNLISYDQTAGYWKNINLTDGTAISITETTNGSITIANTGVTSAVAGTGISVSSGTGAVTITNTAPDQTVSLTGGTGISTSGTYPNFTITNTAPDQTVSITGAGTTTVTGTYPNFTVTSNDQYAGTVTSVAALTLGTTGTDLSSTVANGTTTPVITLQVPTASATNRGALSSADWTTFNGKANAFTYTTNYIPFGQGTTTPNQSANLTFDGTTQSAPVQRASNGIVTNNKTIGTSFTIPSTDNAMSSGPVTISSGVTVTVSSGSRWVVL